MTQPAPAEQPPKRRRVARDARARFKPEAPQALARAEAAVPAEHLARRVQKLLVGADVSQAEAQYSSLGRRGYAPRQVLAVWVYASLIGVHHATKLARLLQTDAALQVLSGGHVISRPVLTRFRRRHGALFQAVLEQTVQCALKRGWVQPQGLAVDSLRLRAHASPKQVRLRKQSEQRLQELSQVDTSALSPAQSQEHQQKVHKHTQAVELCTQAHAASVVLTNTAAALMQFPGDVYGPGHRLTVTASGAQSRLVVGVQLNAAPNDTGQLGPALLHAREVLGRAGLPTVVRLHATADAGYFTKADLAFAQEHSSWVDVLVEYKKDSSRLSAKNKGYFTRQAFSLVSRHEVLCPAQKKMAGPRARPVPDFATYRGQGCTQCPLHSRCTPSERRQLVVHWDFELLRSFMQERMKQEGARARYHQRMATVEPVFSMLEDSMGFRRASSRHPTTVRSEVFLKLLAYNISRLFACHRRCCFLLRPPCVSGCFPPRASLF